MNNPSSPQPAEAKLQEDILPLGDSLEQEFEDAHKTFLDEAAEREREAEREHHAARHDYEDPDSGFAYDYAQHAAPKPAILPSATGVATPPRGKALRSKKLADVRPELVPWLWAQRISFGSLTILDGDPGCGKTSIVIDLMARLSRGDVMPFEAEAKEPMNCLIVSAEDSLAHTLRPRAEAARADLDRVFAMTEFVSLPSMVEALKETIQDTRSRLVLIDPILGMIDPKINTGVDSEARLVLSALAQVAAHTESAIVLVRHLNKAMHSKALYRGGASIAFTAATRNALVCAVDKKGKGYFLANARASLSQTPPTLRYELVDLGGVVTVRWKDIVAVTADEALEQGLPGVPGQPSDGARQERKLEKLSKQLLSTITVAGDQGVTKSDLRKVVGGKHETVDEVLDRLVEEGWITFTEESEERKGGRPSKRYRPSPDPPPGPQEDFDDD